MVAKFEQLKKSNPLTGTSRWVPPAGGSHVNASRSVDFDSPGIVFVCVRVHVGACVSVSLLIQVFPAARSQAMPIRISPLVPTFDSSRRILQSAPHNMQSMHFTSQDLTYKTQVYWLLPQAHRGCVRRSQILMIVGNGAFFLNFDGHLDANETLKLKPDCYLRARL